MYKIENLKLIKNSKETCWELVEVLDTKLSNGDDAHLLAKFYDSNKKSKSQLGTFLLKMLNAINEEVNKSNEQ